MTLFNYFGRFFGAYDFTPPYDRRLLSDHNFSDLNIDVSHIINCENVQDRKNTLRPPINDKSARGGDDDAVTLKRSMNYGP